MCMKVGFRLACNFHELWSSPSLSSFCIPVCNFICIYMWIRLQHYRTDSIWIYQKYLSSYLHVDVREADFVLTSNLVMALFSFNFKLLCSFMFRTLWTQLLLQCCEDSVSAFWKCIVDILANNILMNILWLKNRIIRSSIKSAKSKARNRHSCRCVIWLIEVTRIRSICTSVPNLWFSHYFYWLVFLCGDWHQYYSM